MQSKRIRVWEALIPINAECGDPRGVNEERKEKRKQEGKKKAKKEKKNRKNILTP